MNFVSHPAENGELFGVRSARMSGIVERPMVPVYLPGKNRARLIGIPTNSDYRFNGAGDEFVQVLGPMRGKVDPDLPHHLDGQWMHEARGLRTGARHVQDFAGDGAQ